jgi:hypothetical protein
LLNYEEEFSKNNLKHNNEKFFVRNDLKTIQQEKTEEEKEMVRSEKSVLLVYIFLAFSAIRKAYYAS